VVAPRWVGSTPAPLRQAGSRTISGIAAAFSGRRVQCRVQVQGGRKPQDRWPDWPATGPRNAAISSRGIPLALEQHAPPRRLHRCVPLESGSDRVLRDSRALRNRPRGGRSLGRARGALETDRPRGRRFVWRAPSRWRSRCEATPGCCPGGRQAQADTGAKGASGSSPNRPLSCCVLVLRTSATCSSSR